VNKKTPNTFILAIVYCTYCGLWSLKAGFVDIAKMRRPSETDLPLQAPQDPRDSLCLSTEEKYH